MVEAIFEDSFKRIFLRIKDKTTKEKIIKLIMKIKKHPEIGKPMRFCRKSTREMYLKPYRISYRYQQKKNTVEFLDLYHKDDQ